MRGQRGERAREARKTEILEAAEKVFAHKGYHEASVAEIAEAADYAAGSIYLYFKGKQELFFTMLERKFQELRSLVETEASREGAPIERLRGVVAAVLGFFERNREFLKLYISYSSDFEWNIRDELGQGVFAVYLRYVEVMIGLVEEGVQKGELRLLGPQKMGRALIGMINAFIFQSLREPHHYSLSRETGLILEIFLRGCHCGEDGQGR